EHVRPVGRGDQNHAFVGLETIHLDQQLVEGLLALVMAAAQAGTTMASDSVDFVVEIYAGRILFPLDDQIANARGAHSYEHLNEVAAGNRKEGHTSLAGNGARKQSLTSARRPDQQYALGNPATKPGKPLGVLEELDYLFEFVLGLVNPGDV